MHNFPFTFSYFSKPPLISTPISNLDWRICTGSTLPIFKVTKKWTKVTVTDKFVLSWSSSTTSPPKNWTWGYNNSPHELDMRVQQVPPQTGHEGLGRFLPTSGWNMISILRKISQIIWETYRTLLLVHLKKIKHVCFNFLQDFHSILKSIRRYSN